MLRFMDSVLWLCPSHKMAPSAADLTSESFWWWQRVVPLFPPVSPTFWDDRLPVHLFHPHPGISDHLFTPPPALVAPPPPFFLHLLGSQAEVSVFPPPPGISGHLSTSLTPLLGSQATGPPHSPTSWDLRPPVHLSHPPPGISGHSAPLFPPSPGISGHSPPLFPPSPGISGHRSTWQLSSPLLGS